MFFNTQNMQNQSMGFLLYEKNVLMVSMNIYGSLRQNSSITEKNLNR